MRANKQWLRWWPLIFLLCTVRLPAQDALRKRVVLPGTQISANDLRKEISRQTGLQFSFGSNTFRPGQQIRLQKKDCSARELLDMMKLQLQTDYKVYQDHVIFTASRKKTADINTLQTPNGQQDKVTGKKQSITPEQIKRNTSLQANQSNTPGAVAASAQKENTAGDVSAPGSNASAGNTPSTGNQEQSPNRQTTATPPVTPPAVTRPLVTIRHDERLRQKAYRVPLDNLPTGRNISSPVSTAAPASRKQRGFGGNNQLITRYTTAGVEVNETFPANFVFKGGIPLLHGIVSFSTTARYSSWRFGAGTRWSFNDLWHAQANFTTGKVKDVLKADSLGSISKTVDITETLHRIGLQAERSIGKRWAIVGGISWNMLNRTNAISGERLSPGERIFNDPVPEKGYQAIKPFYTISSSFHESSKTWKDRWIGIQVGAYFRF